MKLLSARDQNRGRRLAVLTRASRRGSRGPGRRRARAEGSRPGMPHQRRSTGRSRTRRTGQHGTDRTEPGRAGVGSGTQQQGTVGSSRQRLVVAKSSGSGRGVRIGLDGPCRDESDRPVHLNLHYSPPQISLLRSVLQHLPATSVFDFRLLYPLRSLRPFSIADHTSNSRHSFGPLSVPGQQLHSNHQRRLQPFPQQPPTMTAESSVEHHRQRLTAHLDSGTVTVTSAAPRTRTIRAWDCPEFG